MFHLCIWKTNTRCTFQKDLQKHNWRYGSRKNYCCCFLDEKLRNGQAALVLGRSLSAVTASNSLGPTSSTALSTGRGTTSTKSFPSSRPHTLSFLGNLVFSFLVLFDSQGVWKRTRHLLCNMCTTKIFILPTSQPHPPRVFLFSVKVNSILPGAQVRHLGVILDACLALERISNPSAHLQSVCKVQREPQHSGPSHHLFYKGLF